MKTKLLPIVIAAFAVFLFSCQSSVTIAKKRYSSGYYVNISHDEKSKTNNTEVAELNTNITVANKKVSIQKENIETVNVAQAPAAVSVPSKEESKAKTVVNKSTTPVAKAVNKLKEAVKKKAVANKTISADETNDMSDRFLIVLLLTIIIPPVGVYLFKQQLRPALIDLLLIVIGVILAPILVLNVFYGLGYLLGLIYGLLYIFEKI
jgi:uncharacterized membrane protein YqaE (UPF0057 family)